MFDELFKYMQLQIGMMDLSFSGTNFIEIAIIAIVLFVFYRKFIKNTQSEKFVKGAFVLVFLWILSEILIRFDLKILGMFLKSVVALVSLSLIVIFQPELRRFLGYLGQADFISKFFGNNTSVDDERVDVLKELIESVKLLSKSHTGALIVFQNDLSNTYYDVGTKLNADLSTELLLTIFHPNTPLHDGAIVVSGNKIISAGVLLPLTEDPKLSWKYGTRHRAAIGMTETSDAACLVVSEETGDISIAIDGILRKYDDIVTFKEDLEKLLTVENERNMENAFISNLLKLRKVLLIV